MTRISADDRRRVAAAVREAEAHTSGEIVTILAQRSDHYLDVVIGWGVAAIFLSLAALASLPAAWVDRAMNLALGWQAHISHHEIVLVVMVWLMLKFGATALILSIRPIRMALTPPALKARRVRMRALDYFRVGAEKRTHRHTAVLIYLSLAERRVEIIADHHIHSRVAPESWGEAAAVLIEGMRRDRAADGLVSAIAIAGRLLAGHFPPVDHNPNELPDRLIEVD